MERFVWTGSRFAFTLGCGIGRAMVGIGRDFGFGPCVHRIMRHICRCAGCPPPCHKYGNGHLYTFIMLLVSVMLMLVEGWNADNGIPSGVELWRDPIGDNTALTPMDHHNEGSVSLTPIGAFPKWCLSSRSDQSITAKTFVGFSDE
jgi:hypothetical protein